MRSTGERRSVIGVLTALLTIAAVVWELAGCSSFVINAKVPDSDAAIRSEAARISPAKWRIPIHGMYVKDMALVNEDRLFVILRADESQRGHQTLMLVDTRSGRPLWTVHANDSSVVFSPVMFLREMLLLRTDGRKGAGMVALDLRTGKRRWEIAPSPGSVSFSALPAAGVVVACQVKGDVARLHAVRLSNGQAAWQRSFKGDTGLQSAPDPIGTLSSLYVFYAGVARLNGRDGHILWKRTDIVAGHSGLPVQLYGGSLYLLDGHQRVQRLSANSGRTQWRRPPSVAGVKVTNLFATSRHLYLRGKAGGDDENPYLLQSYDLATGRHLWDYRTQTPLVSNLIEHRGRVYGATAYQLLCLDQASGGRYFVSTITNSARTYPVHIKRFGGRIVFIGELMVAAVNARGGQVVYKDGFDPVSPGLSLTSLDGYIKHLQAKQRVQTNRTSSGYGQMASMESVEAMHYQNLSNHYSEIATEKWGEYENGGGLSSDMAYYESAGARAQANMDASFSRSANMMALQMSLTELGEQLTRAFEAKSLARRLERERFRRRIILTAYGQMDTGEYAYRPNLDYRAGNDQYLRVTLIHLPTGHVSNTILAPPEGPFGLWCLVDPVRQVVYQNTVGMDPSAYKYSDNASFLDGVRYLQTFIIAQPVTLPH